MRWLEQSMNERNCHLKTERAESYLYCSSQQDERKQKRKLGIKYNETQGEKTTSNFSFSNVDSVGVVGDNVHR